MLPIKFKKICPDSKTPTRAYENAACWDLYTTESAYIKPGEGKFVYVGISLEIPVNWMGIIYTRSGHGIKHNLRNHLGIIDSDYRGDISPYVFNHGKTPYKFNIGDKCAQIFFQPVFKVDLVEAFALNNTKRGSKGFGSSDKDNKKGK